MQLFLQKRRIQSAVLLAAFLLTANLIHSQTTITKTFRPGPAEGIDAQVVKIVGCNPGNPNAESGNGNYADWNELNMSQWTYNGLGCGEGTIRSFIKFAQLNTIPSGAVIQSAKLSLYGLASNLTGPQGNSYYPGSPYNSYGENKCWIQKVTSDWNENTLTFNNQPPTTSLNQAEIPASTSQFSSNALNIDVTQLVKDIMAGQNYGFMIRQQIEQYYRNVGFSSSDATDSTRWPKLEVTYTVPNTTPEISINDIIVNENVGTARLMVCLSAPTNQQVTVNCRVSHGSATAGQDYPINSSVLATIAPGLTCGDIAIQIIDDTIKESTEDIVFVIESAVNATIGDAYGAINIIDNDDFPLPKCSKNIFPANNDSVAVNTQFEYRWNKVAGAAYYQIYIWRTNEIEPAPMPPGNGILPDTFLTGVVGSPVELYWYVVPVNANGQAIGCNTTKTKFSAVSKVPVLPVLNIFDFTVNENVGNALLEVGLSATSTLPVTVKYRVSHGSATAGQDYVATSGTLTIPPGQLYASTNVSIIDDTQKEPTEDIVFVIENATNATIGDAYGAINILDNDDGNFVCPPGAICLTNTCPATTVNLNNAYSVANLPAGTTVSWHTSTPATNANKLSAVQAAAIGTSGNYYAAINISGANCYSATVLVVVNIKACTLAPLTGNIIPAAIEASNKKLSIAPNPFVNNIQASVQAQKDEKVILTVMDIFGREIKSKIVQLTAGKNQVTVDGLGKLPAGNYLLRVASGSTIETHKIVKQE
jgi:Calx-beta domain/Secretion system C-terminal sorting domain